MKFLLPLFIPLIFVANLFGQECCPYIDEIRLSPDPLCSDENIAIHTTVTTPNQGEYFGYEVFPNSTGFLINACYAQGLSTALQTYEDVIDLGIWPEGEYTLEYVAYLSETFDADQCINTATQQNSFVGSFTVSTCGTSVEATNVTYFSVFPNPVNDQLNIEWNQNNNTTFLLELFDVAGMKIENKTLPANTSNFQMSVEHLPEGIYLLNITYNNNTFTSKIIIK